MQCHIALYVIFYSDNFDFAARRNQNYFPGYTCLWIWSIMFPATCMIDMMLCNNCNNAHPHNGAPSSKFAHPTKQHQTRMIKNVNRLMNHYADECWHYKYRIRGNTFGATNYLNNFRILTNLVPLWSAQDALQNGTKIIKIR